MHMTIVGYIIGNIHNWFGTFPIYTLATWNRLRTFNGNIYWCCFFCTLQKSSVVRDIIRCDVKCCNYVKSCLWNWNETTSIWLCNICLVCISFVPVFCNQLKVFWRLFIFKNERKQFIYKKNASFGMRVIRCKLKGILPK